MTYFKILGALLFVFFTSANAVNANLLCPNPKTALDSAPGSLAAVQGDIDRLNLCVERMKLINELNKLQEVQVEKKEAPATQPVNPFTPNYQKPAVPMFTPPALSNIPSMPAISEPEAAPEKKKPTPKTRGDQVSWRIVRLWSEAGTMKAQLVDDAQKIAIVKNGDTLQDGSKVTSLSVSNVEIETKSGKKISLRWAEG